LAEVLSNQGKLAVAEDCYRAAMLAAQKLYGEEHWRSIADLGGIQGAASCA